MICHKGQSSFLCLWIVTRMKIIGLKKIITSTRGYSHPPPRPPLLSKRICQKYKLLKRGVRSQLPSPPLMVHFTLSFFCNLILYKLNGFYTYSQWHILLLSLFSCPGQRNKWHCWSVGRSQLTIRNAIDNWNKYYCCQGEKYTWQNNQSLQSIKEWP